MKSDSTEGHAAPAACRFLGSSTAAPVCRYTFRVVT
jgi:hypothetical protein